MGSLFSPCYGAVEVKRPDCAATDVLSVEVGGSKLNAIITGFTLELSGNYQFLHTLQDLVYFHAFGDRVGTLNVTGLGFVKSCANIKDKGAILNLYKYYNDNKVTKSGNTPKLITISGGDSESITLWGFLTGVRIDVSDSQMGPVGYWSLRFEVLPQKS